MLRWMCCVTRLNRIRNERIRDPEIVMVWARVREIDNDEKIGGEIRVGRNRRGVVQRRIERRLYWEDVRGNIDEHVIRDR